MEIQPVVSPPELCIKPDSSKGLKDRSFSVVLPDGVIKPLGRNIGFKFCMDGDEIEITQGMRTIGGDTPIGIVSLVGEDGNYRAYISLPPLWSWLDQIKFFHVLEHEMMHLAIAPLEGWKTSGAFDETWYGGDYGRFLVRTGGVKGYHRALPVLSTL